MYIKYVIIYIVSSLGAMSFAGNACIRPKQKVQGSVKVIKTVNRNQFRKNLEKYGFGDLANKTNILDLANTSVAESNQEAFSQKVARCFLQYKNVDDSDFFSENSTLSASERDNSSYSSEELSFFTQIVLRSAFEIE